MTAENSAGCALRAVTDRPYSCSLAETSVPQTDSPRSDSPTSSLIKKRFTNGVRCAICRHMLKDIRYAFRTLRQNPGFAATAIISIALAIGANSAIFSMADGLLLRPMPVPDASRIVSIRARTPSGNFGNLSYPDFVDFRDKSRSFEGLVAYDLVPAGLANNVEMQPQLKTGYLVSGNFFQVLRIEPQLGRAFRPEEDQVQGRDAVVVLSYDLWQSEFAGDPSVVGRQVRLNDLDFV